MARLRLVLAVIALLLAIQGVAFGGGLSFDHNGAAAMGMANAFAGDSSDPSAIFYNPAGITQLPGTQILAGTAVVYLDTVFRSSTTGESTHLENQFTLIPHFYVTHRFKSLNDRLSIGLGIYNPLGLLIDWPDNWQGRFDSIFAKLRVTVINPTVAFQVTPNLSVATGFRYANVAAEFQQKFDAGTGESKARVFDATANPIGWNVGVLYHATQTTAVGLQFRSEIQAKLNGSAEFSGPAAMLFANTGFHSSIKLPPQLVAGISTKVIPQWKFNADIEWQGWRTLGSIQKHFETTPQSPFNQQLLDSPGPRLWRNSYVYRLGAEYAATDQIVFRGGYYYAETPIPDNTFDPTIPESNLHALTGGLGYTFSSFTLDVAYLIGFYGKRSINSSTLDPDNTAGPTTFGSYSTTAHVLTASIGMKF